ncbi:hypothetical protein MFMK1_001108 [Metallumcola ferriviriculae]|uniref:GT-D fold-like domain-containing protein n=1 Tax=Metallumcola ferriviriculae TaxID=3039180 RepID=A0AAU0UM84_9FIRM|nr:hypothetical protein MFMK1_001108 [Desulfitibacteraceae bacterium MK1]
MNTYHVNEMFSVAQVMERLQAALVQQEPHSIIRIGHAEMYVMSINTWPEITNWPDRIKAFDRYLKYCGITGKRKSINDSLIRAVLKADIVGTGDHIEFWRLQMEKIFRYYGIRPEQTCSAWVSQKMIATREFFDVIRGKRIVLVGRRAKEAVAKFEYHGVKVVQTRGLEGFEEVETTLNWFEGIPDFDIALVAAGVPATTICPAIAELTGRIAIDFGHALDLIIDGQPGFHFEELVTDFNLKHKGGV